METSGRGPGSEGAQFAMPRHVAVIMDGNGRWARQRSLPRTMGHRAGVEAVRMIVEECARRGISALTLFAFSSENWKRPQAEVGLIMELFAFALQREAKRLHRNGVKLRVIGDRAAFSESLQKLISDVEQQTKNNSRLMLQIAANYGGRWDLVQAARRLAGEVSKGRLAIDEITEQTLSSNLSFPDLPDPDLFIRTGGEQRLSNFLLWQAAYSELYFTDILWPDFGPEAFAQALQSFGERERRFGCTSEQVRGDG